MPYYRLYRRRYGRKLSPRRRLRKKTTRGKKNSTSFSKKVLKVIHRASETKQMEPIFARVNEITNWLQDPITQCIPLIPKISQGNAQQNRVGNQITTRKATLSLNLNAVNITPNTNGYVPPMYFDIYIYKWKRSDNVSAIDLRKFLQYGNTTASFKSNTLPESQNFKVNADSFTLKYHKRILLWNQNYSQATNPSGLALTNCRNIINSKNITIDITKYLNKNMIFQDATTNTPNDNLYVSVVGTPNDHNTNYVDGIVLGYYDAMLQYQFDDF